MMEFVMETVSVNDRGNMTLGGVDLTEIAQKYGTPAYVMDENYIRENCRVYINSIKKFYDGNGLALYASKALSCKYIYRIMKEEGMGVDVVSGGELYTALAADFPAEKIYFHGNNKTNDELEFALEKNVGRIVADNFPELDRINAIAKKLGKTAKILFRIKPGIDAHTHSFVQTGQIDSKFGFALETGEAEQAVKYASELENVEPVGVHCHIGSQIFELDPFKLAAEKMMNFIGDLKDKYGIEIKELNLGGGYGIKYTEEDDPIAYDKYIEAVSKVVRSVAAERKVALPFVIMEPGRSIVSSAGLTVYTVGAVKEIPNIRTYVSVDGGMGDNPRYILYQSKYQAAAVSNPHRENTKKVTVAGKCCESGDILVSDAELPEMKSGDLLAVLATGAYNYSMASNYNRIPRPPIVMIKDGKTALAVKRESYEDLVINDL